MGAIAVLIPPAHFTEPREELERTDVLHTGLLDLGTSLPSLVGELHDFSPALDVTKRPSEQVGIFTQVRQVRELSTR